MRVVTWTDRRGWKHRSLVRDGDPDEAAPSGVLQDPPDLEAIDWEAVKKEIHNRLVDEGLVTWQDVQMGQNKVTGIVNAVVRRYIISLYRMAEIQEVNDG